MHSTRKVTDDLIYVGGSDRRLSRFENLFPIPKGVSYNSYVLLDEKTVLFDTADESISRQYIENVVHALNGRPLDYMVVQHMEPDHCAMIDDMLRRYPEAKMVCSAKAVGMFAQFYGTDVAARALVVKEGDKLSTGEHTLHFVMAPMVHWPEVMVTYDEKDKILFSADAFGTFGALAGNIFNDEITFDTVWMNDARRYYTNIVGKYGVQVQALLKKAASLDIEMICPLHGPIWRKDLGLLLEKYQKWSTYEPEDKTVMIAYATMYGMAPMVHWPEVMVTYDEKDKILFSADAFGTFGALAGNIFNDEITFDTVWMNDARRYYTNIVGKYGVQVQALLKKAASLDIEMICPLHGPIWRKDLGLLLEKYQKWSTYEPEDKTVMIAYATMYGNTENAANVLAGMLADKGVKNIAMYDVSETDVSELVAESFRCSHLVLAAPTYNSGIQPKMEAYLSDIKALNLQNRTVAVIDNGTWAATAGKQMIGTLEGMKNMTILENTISIKSALAENQLGALEALADELAKQVNG